MSTNTSTVRGTFGMFQRDYSLQTASHTGAARSEFGGPPEGQTVSLETVDVSPLDVTSGGGQLARQPDLLDRPGTTQEVAAVVDNVSEHTVSLRCQGLGQVVEISLPIGMIPQHVASYGTPVSISLDTAGRYKRPVITRREVAVERTAEDRALDEWIDSNEQT